MKRENQTSELDVRKLIHELEVHKVELEAMNEELIQSATALQASSEKYFELFDFAPSGYLTLSPKGEILEINRTGSKMLGRETVKIINSSFAFFVSEDTRAQFNDFLTGVFKANADGNCDITLLTDDSISVYVHLEGNVNKTRENCLVTMVDISKARLLHDELLVRENKYRMLFSNNPQPMVIYDLESLAFLEVNQAAIDHYGYSKEEFLSMTLKDIRPAEDIPALMINITTAKRSLNSSSQWRHIRKNGELIFVEVTSHSIVFNGRNARHVLINDITARKKAEDSLNDSRKELMAMNAQLTMAQQMGRLGSWWFDVKSQVLWGSPEAQDIYGLGESREYFTLETIENCIPDRERVHQALIDLVEHGTPYDLEYMVIPADGTAPKYSVSKAIVEMDADGNPATVSGIIQDITDRKAKENKLRKSEEKFRHIFEGLQDAYYEAALDGTILEISPSIAGISKNKYHRSELIGRSLIGFYANPDDRNMFFSDLFKNGTVTDYEMNFLNRDGSVVPLSISSKLILDEQGNPTKITGTMRDVTERRQAADAVRQSEALYHAILNASPDDITITDLEGRIQMISDAALPMFRYTRKEEVLGFPLTDFIIPGDRDRAKDSVRRMLRGVNSGPNEFFALRSDGTSFEIEVNGDFIRDNFGNPTRMIFVVRDITERKRSERKLVESEERFRQVVEQAREVVWEVDPTGLYTYVSPLSVMVYGYTPEQMVGKLHFYDLHPEDRKEQFKEAALEIFRNKSTISNMMGFIIRAEGNRTYISTNGIPMLNDLGDLVGYRGTDTDITERFKYEEELLKFRTISDHANYGTAIASMDGVLVYLNDALAEMHGYVAADLYGKNLAILHGEGQVPRVVELLTLLREQGGFKVEEVEHCRKDGSVFPTLMSASIIHDADGMPQFMSATVIDITSLKEAECALKQSEKDLNYAQEIAGMGSWELNLLTMQLSGSNNYYHQLELNATEKLDNLYDCFYKLLHPDDRKVVGDQLKSEFSENETRIFNLRMVFPGGKVKWLQNTIVPVFENGSVVALKGINVDVTDIILAEEQIKKQNERLNAIIAAMPDMIFVIDRDGIYREVYCSTPDMLVVPPEQIVGTNINNIFIGESGKMHHDHIMECIRKKRLVTYDYVLKRGENEGWFESRLTPFGDDQVLALIRDITPRKLAEQKIQYLNTTLERKIEERTGQLADTNSSLLIEIGERKKAEEELAIGKQRLDDIIKGTNIGTWEWNVQTGETRFNERWAGIIGYTLDEIAPISIETWMKYAHPDDFKVSGELLGKHFNGELDYYSFESRMKHKDGSWVWVLDRGKVHAWDMDGKPLMMAGTHLDITARKNAEALLHSKMALLEAKKNATLDGVLVVDQDQKRILINNRLIEIFNVPEDVANDEDDSALLKHVVALTKFPDEFLEKVMYLYLHPYETSRDEIEFKNGMVLERYSAPVLGLEGQLYGRIWSFHDITSRKRSEEEIVRARNEAEHANLAKSEFISRMSHELRTPMNSILGFAQLMGMGDLNPSHRKGVNHILNSGKHLLNLINEVLDISRIEAGHLALDPEPVQLFPIIQEALEVIHSYAVQRDQALELTESPSNALFVVADRQRLRQVLLNLINNAVKYNRDGGKVFVKTELTGDNQSLHSRIRISVTDTGPGIRAEDLGKLFVPFERIGAERTTTEGTGLGLALVKELMDAMGGAAGVESKQGEGSTFWIELPQAERLENHPGKQEASQTHVVVLTEKGGRLLYIEDNIPNAELVEGIIAAHRPSIQLITGMYGKLAIGLAKEHMPDLILLDLNLHDMNGQEVLDILKSDPLTKAIPVVVSADILPETIEKLKNAGACDYLSKPIDIVAFLNCLDVWIGGSDDLNQQDSFTKENGK
ncbi:MAG: PAS domain S-box protein [Bacteroidales bacterium]